MFSFADRAKRHAELWRQWRELIAAIEARGKRDFNESDVSAWIASAADSEAIKPPALAALVTQCQNQLHVVDGHPEGAHSIGPVSRVFMHILDLPPKSTN